MFSEIYQTILFSTASGICFGASVSQYARAICLQKRSYMPIVLKLFVVLFLYLAFRNGREAFYWGLAFFVLGACAFLSVVLLARKKRLR